MTRVALSIGSNVEPERHLKLAVAELERRFGCLDRSPVYRNAAVGFEGDDFLNMVAIGHTDASLEEVNAAIAEIHTLAGRQRSTEKFASRTLDIDILLFGDLVAENTPVSVPRADILRYAFVLKPLSDIAPDERHPVSGSTFAEHWREMAVEDDVLELVVLDFD